MTYIHTLPTWPTFTWDQGALVPLLTEVRMHQGRLLGRMQDLGFTLRAEAVLQTLTADVIKSNDIEGETLDPDQVRSSIARRLGVEIGGLIAADRHVEGVVELMLDATQAYDTALTEDRLYDWHAALFPTGRSGMSRITVRAWREDASGPMQVVSGPIGHEKVHYKAPAASRLKREMTQFVAWFNAPTQRDPVIKAAIAHLWFVTIHPFDDGNGRIARAIADMALARSEQSRQRFYSMSSQIREERAVYYEVLEATQKGDLYITVWLDWFLRCLDRAIMRAETTLVRVLHKARFWERHAGESFNARQTKVLNMLLEQFEGKLTSSKWAKVGKCSQDSATRNIANLIQRGILVKDPAGGRSCVFRSNSATDYALKTARRYGGKPATRYASKAPLDPKALRQMPLKPKCEQFRCSPSRF